MIGDGPNDMRRDRKPIARAFPFHDLTLLGPPRRRYGACVGFLGATYDVMLAAPFEILVGSPANLVARDERGRACQITRSAFMNSRWRDHDWK